jgi:hypothetical protein
MDMKKILQAMDGISTKPVEGSDSMAKFLRVVKEAEINQPVGLPAVTPIKVPPVPQLPAQDGDQGNGEVVKTNADGTRTYSGAFGTFIYDAQGKAIKYSTPNFNGLGQTVDLTNNQTTRKYNSGPIATSQRVDANGKPLQTKINYDIGTAKMGYDNDHEKGIRSAEFTPHPDMPPELFKPKDMYARGNKDREATYDRAMAQVNGTPVQENNLSKFLSIVDKNNVSILSEGANPHKVALPVQMAMQHYQQPKETLQPRERLIDKYFVEAETEITQRKEEKRALINQYAKTIAERVLMKEGAEGFNTAYLEKAAESNRVGRYMISIADARAELARRVGSQDPHTEPPTKPIPTGPTGYSKEYLQKAADPKRFGRYMISVEKAQELLKQMNEAPIEMTGDANDPHIYGHEKANPMSLKGRIAQARAQLKELAELAESDSLLAWEQICKKAKGGMFMGLEQNLEQIRHGISELAAKRRKGGVQSRGINPNIGEQGTSPVVNKVANTLVSAGSNARQAIDKAISSIPKPFDEKEVAKDLKSGQAASVTKKK